ncbi:MAG: hypothetical protein JOZ48_06950 [Acidobacteriaceae bacterium]|nr:hypothetical protein [Acidobacteriaceae bacterium]
MTIAVGLLATDGIVLAADAQECIPGYAKRKQHKIMPGSTSGACIAVTGAGNSTYIDHATSEIIREGLNLAPVTASEYQANLQATLRDIYEKHVIPFASYPDDYRPDFSLLIAAGNKFGTMLFVSDKNLLTNVHSFEAVGCGAFMAKTLLSTLYKPFPTLEIAECLAVYVILQVKRFIDGCGDDTGVVTVTGRQTRWEGDKRVKEIEDLCAKFVDIQNNAFHHVIGYQDFITGEQIQEEDIRLNLSRLKDCFRPLISQTSEGPQ